MPEMRTAIDKRIPVDAGKKEIGTYLKEIMRRIDRGKETPELSSAMHFLFGRLLLVNGEYERAHNEFRASSTLCVEHGLAEQFEIGFWIGKIAEIKKDFERAKGCYQMALRFCENNPLFISSVNN